MKITASIQTEKPVTIGMQDERSGGNSAFKLVKPNYYTATVTGVTENKYKSKAGDEFYAITPEVVLHNEEGTTIGRQSLTVGKLLNGAIVPTREGKPAVWAGERGAMYFFVALGLMNGTDTNFTLDCDPTLLSDRVVLLKTGYGAYVKGGQNWDATDVAEAAEAVFGKEWADVETEKLRTGVAEQLGVSSAADFRLKNAITNWFMVSRKEIEDNGWYTPDGKQVFINEVAYQSYFDILAKDGNEETTPDW